VKKIDRYFLTNTFKPFLTSVFALTLLLLVNSIFQLMDLLIKKGVPFAMVSKVVLYTLPYIMNMTIPMSFLVAGLVSFGRMASNNEIVVIKSSGIDWKVPFLKFVIAITIFSILNIAFNFWPLPESNYALKKTLFEIRVKKPAIQIEPGIFNKIENYLIYAEKKDEKTGLLFGVKIQEVLGDRVRFISARKGKIISLEGRGVVLELQDGEFVEVLGQKREEFRRGDFKKDVVVLKSGDETFLRDAIFKGDREKTILELVKEIKEIKGEMAKMRKDDKISIDFSKRRINVLLSEIHTRVALPVASVIFVVLAFPIAIKYRFSGYGSALGVSFFFFILYYILLLLGQEVARRTLINSFCPIWIPNFIFGLLAYFFVKKEMAK